MRSNRPYSASSRGARSLLSRDRFSTKAIEDALRSFPADELIVVTLPEEDAAWLEKGSAETALDRSPLPVTHLVVQNQRL
jgi:hypothetical protein